jgi:predicted porin
MKLKNILAISSVFFLSNSYAAEWTLKPHVNPSFRYNDNVLMSSTNEESSFITSVRPTLELGYETENFNIGINTGYSISRYSSLSRLNEDDLFFDVSGLKTTERATWGLSANYNEDAARNTAAEDTGDFSSTATIKTTSISPSYSYNLTELESISLSSVYSEREYSTDEFDDNKTKSVSLVYSRQFTEKITANMSFSYSLYESGTSFSGTENDNYSLSVGASYAVSELWALSGQVGSRILKSKQFLSGATSSSSSSGSFFNLTASFTSELDTISVNYAKALSPSSTGDVNEQESMSGNWSRLLTEKLSIGASASYSETQSATIDEANKRTNFSIKPSMRYDFSEKVSVELNYEYKNQKRTSQDSSESNSVFISFNYDWTGYKVSR